MWYYCVMDFDYVLADPTGNITVLITSPYTPETRSKMIQDAFAKEPDCEQVGFVMPCEGKRIRLEMMAYEFCGNATLSSAALLCQWQGLPAGSEDIITVDSSGAGKPVDVRILRLPDLEENGIQSVDEIELNFKILDENFTTIAESGAVTFSTKS